MARIHGQERPALIDRVTGHKGNLSAVRIRLVPLYGSDVVEAVPDKNGGISFPADPGIYVLVTVIHKGHGAVVADWRDIRMTGTRTVTIDLGNYRDK